MDKQSIFWEEKKTEFVNIIQMNFIFLRGEILCVAL
jgi:hypothetical protein